MAYDMYLNGELMPVTPGKVQSKIKGNNKTVELINEGEVNVIKPSGLTEISFELLLPNQSYPFSNYQSGYRGAKYYVDFLQGLKDNGTKFQFILARHRPQGTNLGNIDITVTVEDLTVTDEFKEGFDLKASVKLKQWRAYGTKTYAISTATKTISADEPRTPSSDAPSTGGTYTVKKGDCLWKIAKQFYGSGSDYTKIFNSNTDQIKNPNLIYPGQVLQIP